MVGALQSGNKHLVQEEIPVDLEHTGLAKSRHLELAELGTVHKALEFGQ
jgi:hypothetical protein